MGKREIEIKIQEKRKEYEEIKVDGREVLNKLFKDDKYKNIVVDSSYIINNIGNIFFSKLYYVYNQYIKEYGKHNITAGFRSGSLLYFKNIMSGLLMFYDKDNNNIYMIYGNGVMLRNYEDIFTLMEDGINIMVNGSYINIILDDAETGFLQDYVNGLNKLIESKTRKIDTELQLLIKELNDETTREEAEFKSRLSEIEKFKNSIICKYYSTGNGIIEEVENDVLGDLIKKNQSVLIEKDKSKVHNFVKISTFLKGKKNNINYIYKIFYSYDVQIDPDTDKRFTKSIEIIEETFDINFRDAFEMYCAIEKQSTSDEDFIRRLKLLFITKKFKDLITLGEMLEEEINIYKALVFHSVNMVVSLKNDELIRFYEIYDMFDKLSVFNSKWESDVTDKLSNIEGEIWKMSQSLKEMNDAIKEMNNEIVGELISLQYVTESSIQSLETSVNYELQGIKSSVNFNNLLTSVNTYQLSKLNRRSNKQLRG